MKKVFCISFVPLLLLAALMNLKKDQAMPSNSSMSFSKSTNKFVAKPKVRFRWRGIGPNSPCNTSAECGGCPGICVLIEFRSGTISQPEKDLGDGYANIGMSRGKLLFAPESTIDNGDGTVTITDDYAIGSEFSQQLGYNSVTILAGTYPIDYTQGVGYGYVEFSTRTN